MNNRLKVALLVVSLVAITPQIQAAWYHPSAWVAGIQSAATNVSKWWYAKKHTPAEIAAFDRENKLTRELEEKNLQNLERARIEQEKAQLLLQQQAANAREIARREAQQRDRTFTDLRLDAEIDKNAALEATKTVNELQRALFEAQTQAHLSKSEATIAIDGYKSQQSFDRDTLNRFIEKNKEQEKLLLTVNKQVRDITTQKELVEEISKHQEDSIQSLGQKYSDEYSLRLKQTKDLQDQLELTKKQVETNQKAYQDQVATAERLENERNIIAGAAFSSLRDMRNELTDLKETVLDERDAFNNDFEMLQQAFNFSDPKVSDLANQMRKSESEKKEKQKVPTPPTTSAMTKSFTFINNDAITSPFPAAKKIMSDKEVLAAIFKGKKTIKSEKQEDEMNAIIGLNWALYNIAISKGEKFDEGTFVIINKDKTLYQFLFDYMQKRNPKLTGKVKDDIANHAADNAFAYSRESSHFKHLQKLYPHYGIDIRFNNDNKEYAPTSALLPAEKRHILLGVLDENSGKFLLKPENYGLNKDEFWFHAWDYLMTRGIDNDIPNYRKERIPKAFLKEFKQAVTKDNFLSLDDKNELINMSKIEGIKTLVSRKALTSEKLSDLKQKYEKLYDHIEHRTGREVIIDDADIEKYINS